MFDRRKFYDKIRRPLFNGGLVQTQVDGLEALIDEYVRRTIDKRWFAYILATAYHEVDRTMQPIEEYGHGVGHPYVPYYGRGLVQLTWKNNYKKMGGKLTPPEDLVGNPELALRIDIAIQVIFMGMIDGDFASRHKLSRYFNDQGSDWYNARRIVNGLDKATAIAGYATKFYNAILSAEGFFRDRLDDFINSKSDKRTQERGVLDFSIEEEALFILSDDDI